VSDEQSASTNGYPAPATPPPSIPSQPTPISAVPGPSSVGVAASGAPPRRKRSVFRIVVIALVAFIVVGGVIGFVAYDRATAIDRSTPTVTVQQFLTAVFVQREPDVVRLFVCNALPPDEAMTTMRSLVGPDARASWDTVVLVDESKDSSHVDVRLRLSYPGDIGPSGETAVRFRLVRQQDWRVCEIQTAS
jgi:hypothetical protein